MLFWSGQSSFRLEASKRIYFDPYQLPGVSPKADIICITHEHFDHCSLDDLGLISTADTLIFTNPASAGKLKKSGLNCKEIVLLSPGGNAEAGAVRISAVNSYNIGKPFHAKDSAKLGIILAIDGVRFYHAGDTDLIPEMKGYLCDVAFLPVDGTYTMDADGAAQAAMLIKPKLAIPMHYDDVRKAERFRDLLKGKVEVRIMEKEA